MSNLFRGLRPKSKLSRNGFDLSQKHVFTSRPGIALPCLAVEIVPGDHIEINMANLTRTFTLNTAAFIRGKFNFDFYFVPYTQLWHPFNQFINQRTDRHSSQQKGSLYAPTVSLKKVLTLIMASLSQADTTFMQNSDDIFGYNWGLNALRLLDMLGYGAYYECREYVGDEDATATYLAQFEDIYINVFRLAAYQHIWYDIYRNKYFDVDTEYENGLVQKHDYVKYFNFDDIDCSDLASSRIAVDSTLRNNDRVFGLLSQRYVQYKKDLFTSLMPSTQFGAVASIDLSGTINLGSLAHEHNVSLSLQRRANNIDWLPTSQDQDWDGVGLQGRVDVKSSFNANNSPLGIGTIQNDDSYNALKHSHSLYYQAITQSFQAAGSTNEALGNVPSQAVVSSFDVLQLRKAELLQRWKQLTLRAGNMVDDNWNAHFGKTPRYESDDSVLYLGSHSAQLQVNPVEATTQASGQKIGELGATGTSVASGEKIVFDLKDKGDYGIIMAISYFTPENEYNATGIDKANTLYEQFDWFTPEFENIGLEAVTRSNYDFVSHPDKLNDVLGYAPRYWMYKTAIDKVHGEFIDDSMIGNTTLKPWVAPRHEIFFDLNSTNLKIGTRALSTFYVNPAQFNNVFGIELAPGQLNEQEQNNDPFLHNVFFDIKAIRPMSVLGLPQF